MVRRAALLVGAALLGAYFMISSLTQMPLNPVKLRHYDEINSVTQPYLAQNWMLFAPNPVSDDRGILARARCDDGRVTDFYDVTRRYVKQEQGDRFFPSRMNRLVSGTLTQMDVSDPILERLRSTEKEKKKPQIPLLPHEKTSQEQGEKFLARYSMRQLSGVCRGDLAGVQVRVYVNELPSWSQRKDASATGKHNFQNLAWRAAGDLK